MGDHETVVAEPSVVSGYTSGSYVAPVYADSGSNAAMETTPAYEGYSIPSGNDYSVDNTSTGQEANKASVEPLMVYDPNPTVGTDGVGEHVAAYENMSTDPSQDAGFSFSSNGTMVPDSGNVASVEDGNGPEAQQHYVDGSVSTLSAEEERLWSIVRANSLEFNAWTALLEETEKVEDNIVKIRKVYDEFLAEFPLCYGYWKKYADHEARIGSMDKVVEVYERAVLGVTYSVDIWLHYCIFAINTYGDPDTIRSGFTSIMVERSEGMHFRNQFSDVQTLCLYATAGGFLVEYVSRRLFERGLAYVGTDYLSYPLWDKYIEYEYVRAEWSRIAAIYTRILENPNQQLDRYFASFKEFIVSRPWSEIKTAEEAADAVDTSSEAKGQANEGEMHTDAEQPSKLVSAGLSEAEELDKYVGVREEMYKKAKEFDTKIIGFEAAIRRPYFHVRPLNVTELENWHNYLDFIEREDDFSKLVKLYERCLIACANYPEYWIRYVLGMEASGSMDLAENALVRASQIFVKRQPEIHLFAARFKEENGDIPGAQSAYQLVHSEISPGLLEAITRHANMEHRLGNLENAFSLYEQTISIEKGKEHSQTLPLLHAQYARFVFLVAGNVEKARDILVKATEELQLPKPLLEALIHFEAMQPSPKRIDYLDTLVDKFVMPASDSFNHATAAEREELSSIFIEFLGLFGDAQSIKKAENRHAKCFLPHRSTLELRKRHSEDYLASEKAKMAKSYSGAPSPVQSLMGAYPSVPNQWAAAGYVQPQAWPPTTQAAQAQQWTPTPAYTQPAAPYSPYAGYGASYTTPQAPTSVPPASAAAYGAYPPTYQAQQAFPQQSYAQPAVAAVGVAPVPQPASVPQAYYGTYY